MTRHYDGKIEATGDDEVYGLLAGNFKKYDLRVVKTTIQSPVSCVCVCMMCATDAECVGI